MGLFLPSVRIVLLLLQIRCSASLRLNSLRQHRTIDQTKKEWYNRDMERQMTLAEINDELGAARTNKKEFLDKLESVIPWDNFIKIIQPSYYKGELGNKPYPLELMLRIFILQNVYNLADMAVMNEVIDSRAFSNFCGVNSPDEVPNGDTIGRFRNILTRNGLQEKIFAEVVKILVGKGLILKKGTIVDSTFIESPSSTKNREKKRDPEAHSSKKGGVWHFGYKAHIGVDEETGLVHTVKATPANEHDVTVMNELLHGEEERVYGDSGYIGAKKRKDAIKKNKDGKNIKYIINRRPSSIKKLSPSGQYAAKKREHQKSSVRCKVEHVFAVMKNIFRYRKTRYRGLRKQTAKLNIMFALANLYLADRHSLTA
jgi:IS5 family transposase